ncbi:MAG: DUF3467 domain-containing protein [Saprospiraceae bacterium]|nr:DUF3467 domain-containing protein [Saprospiraceae bacterium]
MAEPAKNPNEINIELNEETAEGVYSNLAIISHSQQQFGSIQDNEPPQMPPMAFNTPTAQA